MKKLLIITGGSKGIGSGVVLEYLNNGYSVISISRTKNKSAEFKQVHQIEFDLNDLNQLETFFENVLAKIEASELSAITLMNNAGKLGEISTTDHKTTEDVDTTVRLNTTVPLILISRFLNFTRELSCRKKIINISSGAAKNPYHGWVTYCISKAALDMMTRVVALEQKDLKNQTKIISIYPGVVDTDLQTQIRNSSEADFKDLEKFITYKDEGKLASVENVGKEIFRIDHDDSIESGSQIRVNDNR